MPNDFNHAIITEFRAHRGRLSGMFTGARLLLLTTTGARTGARHTTPLGYLPNDDGRRFVIGSAGGGPNHPDWYHNLLADPRATVEDGVFTYEAEAAVLTGAERDAVWARAVEADPGWAAYQAKTSRILPVVALRDVSQGPPGGGASFGETLRTVHDAFRRELDIIRHEVATTGPRIGAQLRVNCLVVCQGLHHHHAGEDLGIFPYALRRHPESAELIDRLRADHERVAELLAALRAAVSEVEADPDVVRRDVDRLITELEAHLAYEEEHLIPLLS